MHLILKKKINYIKNRFNFVSKSQDSYPLIVTVDRSALPNDVDALKDLVCDYARIIERQAKTIADQAKIIADQTVAITALTARVNQLEERYDKLARLHFGQKSEKQSTLNTTSELPSDPLADVTSDEQKTVNVADTKGNAVEKKEKKSRENHNGRNRLAPHLTRQTIEHDLAANEKICKTCGSFLSFIGCEEREQLESAIEKYIVLVHRRRKYACKNKHCTCQTIVTAPTPFEPIEKGLAGPHLLAEVIVDKYCDHLPWYRLQQRFSRQGITMSRSTLWHWSYRSALLLEPLVDAMIAHQMASDYMFADETTIPTLWVQTPENKGRKAKTNYFWVYTSLLDDNKNTPIVVYRFAEGRGSEYPIEFLKNFKGYLQADAYSGYNPLFNPTWNGIEKAYVHWCIEVGCFAHARRYFVDTLKSNPKSIAQEVVLLIADLYKYEAEFKDKKLTYHQIKEKRQELSKPKLAEIHRWLQQHQPLAPPKSLLGTAITYSLNNWEALMRYLTDGRLEIDNSRSERNMKGVAVGRKNYLFVASKRGGIAAATLYSIVETCRQNSVDPKAYLADVLQRISTHPHSRINELLPYYWQPPLSTKDVALKDGQKVA